MSGKGKAGKSISWLYVLDYKYKSRTGQAPVKILVARWLKRADQIQIAEMNGDIGKVILQMFLSKKHNLPYNLMLPMANQR